MPDSVNDLAYSSMGLNSRRGRDVLGKQKVSMSRNIYEADFEYGKQPLRWEEFTTGGGSITHVPGEGGVRLRVGTASGDITIRQSRPYHRYQPGKTMFMATAVNFGVANLNQIQRVGFFDDSNGLFFEQNVGAAADAANPSGMAVVVRSDATSSLSAQSGAGVAPTDTRIPLYAWSDPQGVKGTIDWTRLQMLWMEYAWYGGGLLRWGVYLNGEPYILHEIGAGNIGPDWTQAQNPITASSTTSLTVAGQPWVANRWVGRFVQYTVSGTTYTGRITANTTNSLTFGDLVTIGALAAAPSTGGVYSILTLPSVGRPWARTGNLPVRYEQRNTGTSVQNDMVHFGVSVLAEGGIDDQRGFTYSYGMTRTAPRRAITGAVDRFPVLTIRNRIMGTQEYTQASSAITAGTTNSLVATGTPWTVNQWIGKYVNYVVAGVNYVARIQSNTASTLFIANPQTGGVMAVAPVAGQNYTIGLVNRGQILPRRLMLSCDQVAVVELISGTATSPVVLTGASFVALNTLGSANSFAERDVSATAYTSGGEVVMAFTSPAGGSGLQDLDLSNLFPLYSSINGSVPDTLTVCVTTTATTNVGAHLIGQEAMS